ncbi:hypothetical protein JOC94_002665 [Bacillus thermophilus]|uniref:Uncharacterized protein n=1 Tax=Siminovitchia thermophila TaxID=1245522 RepID=A0ABS2R7P3_9BACI|nr:hypothetical protein [Siminovitchia thermophila]
MPLRPDVLAYNLNQAKQTNEVPSPDFRFAKYQLSEGQSLNNHADPFNATSLLQPESANHASSTPHQSMM